MTDRSIQDVAWGGYQPFDPGFVGLHSELSRRDARAAYDRLMAAIPDRLDQLRMLLELNDVDMDDLGSIDRWYVACVQENATTPGRLNSWWYAVGLDLGILFGELVIDASEGALRWELILGGKKVHSYQRAAIRGFDVPNPEFYWDFGFGVATYGHQIVAGLPLRPDPFQDWFAGSMERAPTTPS